MHLHTHTAQVFLIRKAWESKCFGLHFFFILEYLHPLFLITVTQWAMCNYVLHACILKRILCTRSGVEFADCGIMLTEKVCEAFLFSNFQIRDAQPVHAIS